MSTLPHFKHNSCLSIPARRALTVLYQTLPSFKECLKLTLYAGSPGSSNPPRLPRPSLMNCVSKPIFSRLSPRRRLKTLRRPLETCLKMEQRTSRRLWT